MDENNVVTQATVALNNIIIIFQPFLNGFHNGTELSDEGRQTAVDSLAFLQSFISKVQLTENEQD